MHMARISEIDGSGLCGSLSAINSCGKGLDTGFRGRASGVLFWIPFSHCEIVSYDAAFESLET